MLNRLRHASDSARPVSQSSWATKHLHVWCFTDLHENNSIGRPGAQLFQQFAPSLTS
jgi:hypothetical protein